MKKVLFFLIFIQSISAFPIQEKHEPVTAYIAKSYENELDWFLIQNTNGILLSVKNRQTVVLKLNGSEITLKMLGYDCVTDWPIEFFKKRIGNRFFIDLKTRDSGKLYTQNGESISTLIENYCGNVILEK